MQAKVAFLRDSCSLRLILSLIGVPSTIVPEEDALYDDSAVFTVRYAIPPSPSSLIAGDSIIQFITALFVNLEKYLLLLGPSHSLYPRTDFASRSEC